MKKIITTNTGPPPVGPYSQAVMVKETLFVSGNIALDPLSGDLILESIEKETHQVMKNLGEILKAAGLGFENVVKTSIFLNDMGNFSRVNTVYAMYFDEKSAPARETVEVSNLPKYVNVEISCIAIKF